MLKIKNIKYIIYISLISFNANAQETLQANVENGKPYIEYVVRAGETLFSLSRQYNIGLKELEAFSKRNLKGSELKKDEVIQIPLTKDNFVSVECNSCKKVFYKVQPHEGLYRIGINFGNIGMTSLKKINNLSVDNVSIGQNLLVGYVKVTTENSIAIVETKEIKEVNTPTEEKIKPMEQVGVPEKEVQKTEKQPETHDIKEQEKTTIDSNKSAFESQYSGNAGVNTSGVAAIFKSSSGWNDAKYYVLMNNVTPGTIVKVTATDTNKIIYAKVLGELPQIKQNNGLLLRINNAAVAALSGGEENIQVLINY